MYKNIFKNIFWISLVFLKSVIIWGQKSENIDCTNEELVTSVFNEPIELTLRGIIKIYENVTINEILSTTNNEFDKNYIDARLENSFRNDTKNLILFTTMEFQKYAQEQNAARISLKINLGCGQGKERVVIFFQPFKEGNYFSPIFSQIQYEMFIPTPIFAGFDLTAFLKITAKDDDLTHNQINFTSNDSSRYHIIVTTKNVTSVDKKTYFASITLQKNLLELPQPIKFEIKATDSGIPSKTSNASVVIRADPKRQLPVKPKFNQSLYKGLISFDFSMQPIEIELINGTYSPEIIFSLHGLNMKGFSLQDHKNGVIDITWNSKNLNRSEILKHAKWELELRAEHAKLAEFGRANVIVALADFQTNFCFMSSYYEGDIDELGELHIDSIIFNPYTYQSDMDFELLTTHDFFNLSIKGYSVQLQLNNNFTWQVIDDVSFLKLTLKASWESLSSATNVIIKLPETRDEVKPQLFQFEKPLYVGQLNETHDLNLETIVLQTDVNNTKQNIEFSLSGNGSSAFYLISNENQIQIQTNFSTNTTLNEYLLVLEAKLNERKTFTSLIIQKLQPVPSTIIKKIFLNSVVMGRIFHDNATDTQRYVGESIRVLEDVREHFENLTFNLTGDSISYFNVSLNFSTQTVELLLKSSLPDNFLQTKQFLNLSLNAFLQAPKMLKDTALILIELPLKECPKPELMQPDPPEFSSSQYMFTYYVNQTGLLGMVSALTSDRNASIHYSIEVQSDILAQRLSIGPLTGELYLYGALDEGDYLFNITAENVKTREKASVKALLKVQPKEECKLVEGITVEKTLIIRHVDEEKPFYGLMDLKFNKNCTFRIMDMWPNDKEYVHVNYIFNMLDAIAIDREDQIFENMSEPQIIVKLRLSCDMDETQNFLNIDIPKPEKLGSKLMLTDDIPYASDVMWLFIKIDDINDNAPQFLLPDDGPLYLGYPSGIVPFEVFPEYLCKVEAFDRDVGVNAKIKFTIKENPYFDIEPVTGKVYPKGKVLEKDQQVELIILATDQYGEGLISGLEVIVKALSNDFYSLITLRDNTTKAQTEVELSLSQETGYDIKVIKMSYVPQIVQQRSHTNESLCCKAWIYGYHRYQLVTFKEMQEQILMQNPNTSTNIVNLESFEEAAYRYTQVKDSQNVYFIATIILSLISCSSIVFIIWSFCYKSTKTLKDDKKSTTVTVESNNNGNVKQIPTICSHSSVRAENCLECHKTNENDTRNCVKFSEHVEDVIVQESQSK